MSSDTLIDLLEMDDLEERVERLTRDHMHTLTPAARTRLYRDLLKVVEDSMGKQDEVETEPVSKAWVVMQSLSNSRTVTAFAAEVTEGNALLFWDIEGDLIAAFAPGRWEYFIPETEQS